MTKFFKLFGAVKGDQQNMFCSIQASGFRSNYATISLTNNKKIYLYYCLGREDYDEYPIHRGNDQETEKEKDEEETEEAYMEESLMPSICLFQTWTKA